MMDYVSLLEKEIYALDCQRAEMWDAFHDSVGEEHEECVRRLALNRGQIKGLERSLDILREYLAGCQERLG